MNRHRLLAVAAIALGLAPVSAVHADDTLMVVQVNSVSVAATKVATTESKSYNLLSGNPRWAAGPAVEYTVVNAPFVGAVAAVDASVATIDPYVTTRAFAHNDATTQQNPCTPGQPNTVQWAPLNGPAGLLAMTELCITKSHEIVGFRTTVDSLDGWSIGNDGNQATYDVQSVLTHEFGHIAGLDTVTKSTDTCLTMYYTTDPEDTQQRTLGLGDKIGLDKLYNTGDTSPGPGCGV